MRNKIFVFGLLFVLTLSALGAVRTRVHTIYEKLTAKLFILDPATITITANMGGAPDLLAEYTITTPSKSAAFVDCQDADGCDLFILETAVSNGQVLTITNKSANAVLVRDAAGVLELSSDFTAGQYDSLTLQYVVDRWVELDEQNN